MIRYPMYLGGLMEVIFSPFALDSYWAILCVIPLILVIIMRIFDEEKRDYSKSKKVRTNSINSSKI